MPGRARRRTLAGCRALAGLSHGTLARLSCRPVALGRALAGNRGALPRGTGSCGRALLRTNGGVYPRSG